MQFEPYSFVGDFEVTQIFQRLQYDPWQPSSGYSTCASPCSRGTLGSWRKVCGSCLRCGNHSLNCLLKQELASPSLLQKTRTATKSKVYTFCIYLGTGHSSKKKDNISLSNPPTALFIVNFISSEKYGRRITSFSRLNCSVKYLFSTFTSRN